MTINLADNTPRVSYAVAQGATQTSFTVSFEFFDAADLNVYVDGTLKTITTHYTVSGGDGSTGTVTMSVTGATGGSTVVITRDIDLKRTTDFPASGSFQIGSLNTELDKLVAIAADLDDKASRALQLTDFDTAVSLVLPDVNTRKGKTLAFNASTGAVEAGPSTSDVQTVSATAADIAALADIEDGTTATDAISGLAAIKANVTTVAGISSNVTTVAGISSNVTAVAGDASDIGTVASNISSVNTNATNISAIQGAAANASTATTKASEAASSATAAAASATTATTQASTATTQASTSTTKAGEAATSATASATSATASATSATASASSATAAAASQTAAAASAASAASAFDNFDDTYLGAKSSNPTQDNDGDALTEGDLYFNTTANEMRVYDGANWIAASSAGTASLILYEYTATSNQTTFSGSDDNSATLSYTVDNLQVVMNGVILDPSDYTATNGTSVVLAAGAATNDLVNIYAFKSFTTADMVSKTNGGTFAGNVTVPQLNADNIRIDGNTISSTDTNGDITLDPNGTGKIAIPAAVEVDSNDITVAFNGADDVNSLILQGSNGSSEKYTFELQADGGGSAAKFMIGSGGGAASEKMRLDASGNVGIGATTVDAKLHVEVSSGDANLKLEDGSGVYMLIDQNSIAGSDVIRFKSGSSGDERMRLNAAGNLCIGKNNDDLTNSGSAFVTSSGHQYLAVVHDTSDTNSACIYVNRQNNDGRLMDFRHANSTEGTISVSGSTVSYNGGHLSRWSRLADNTKPTTLLKGTVLTNLDAMVVWSHDEVLWTEDDDLPDGVSVGDVKTAAYTEDNEQLNHTAISSVEGDANVAGLFVSWDVEDGYNDFYMAMTGDMVIRVASGTTVSRGDLLMSAGDGTAKPQGDDIVRSKTIAKVTSTNVSHTYDDGTFLVPCVLMAC